MFNRQDNKAIDEFKNSLNDAENLQVFLQNNPGFLIEENKHTLLEIQIEKIGSIYCNVTPLHFALLQCRNLNSLKIILNEAQSKQIDLGRYFVVLIPLKNAEENKFPNTSRLMAYFYNKEMLEFLFEDDNLRKAFLEYVNDGVLLPLNKDTQVFLQLHKLVLEEKDPTKLQALTFKLALNSYFSQILTF